MSQVIKLSIYILLIITDIVIVRLGYYSNWHEAGLMLGIFALGVAIGGLLAIDRLWDDGDSST